MQNLDAITAFLRGKGLTGAQIAGVEGNLQVESGGSPTAYNPGEGAIGIVQWEGGRRTNLQAAAARMGTTETDLNAQLSFMWQELTGSESGALHALMAAATPAQAATAFDQQYERSSPASLPARVAAAESIAAGGIQGGSGVTDTGGGATATPAGFLGLPSFPSFTSIGHWIVDGFLVLVGVALIVGALVLIAKDGSGSSTSGSSTPPQPAPAPREDREREPGPGHEVEGGAGGDAGELGEVAAA